MYAKSVFIVSCLFFFQAEDGIRDLIVTGVQTCALPIYFSLIPGVGQQRKMVDVRPLDKMDRAFLEEMLFEAFFWNPSWSRPRLAEFREQPEFTKLLADWGRPGDRGVVAQEQRTGIAAAWFRLWGAALPSSGCRGARDS